MLEVGRAVGWTIYEHDQRYYVRIEEVVVMLSNSSTARDILRYVLTLDTENDAKAPE